jgi:hypothetical protein
MISKDLSQSVSQTANHMADQAAQNTDRSIDATRSMVGQKMDGMADSMKHIHDQAAPLLDRASEVAAHPTTPSLTSKTNPSKPC